MSRNLSLAPREDTCEGAGKGAEIIQLPVTPKLRAIDGGKPNDRIGARHGDIAIDDGSYTSYVRPNLGKGHHKAQRPWEIRSSARENITGVLLDEIYLEHLDHEILAASTTFRRADGVMVTAALTHNAYEQLIGTRLRVPTDIGEYNY